MRMNAPYGVSQDQSVIYLVGRERSTDDPRHPIYQIPVFTANNALVIFIMAPRFAHHPEAEEWRRQRFLHRLSMNAHGTVLRRISGLHTCC